MLLKMTGLLLMASPAVPFVVPNLIQISIGLEPENRNGFERTLYRVSDPQDPSYGQHLSRDEAKALLQPSRASTDAVKRWLAEAGIADDGIVDQGQFIDVRLSMQQARGLLGPHHQVLADAGDREVQNTQAALPPELRGRVASIYRPLDRDGAALRLKLRNREVPRFTNTTAVEEDCRSRITPACLAELYRIDDKNANNGAGLIGIAGFGGQAAQFDQIQHFLDMFAPQTLSSNFSVELVNGGQNPQGNVSSGEANLDVEYALSMAPSVPVRFYPTGGRSRDFFPDLDFPSFLPRFENLTSEPFIEFVRHFLDMPDADLPRVISISYGINEQNLPAPYARQVCDMFGQLGARGVSVIVASGDSGPGASCLSNEADPRPKFLPVFPATCPYVTSVGATEGFGPETAANFSSGGFSEVFARPWWQDDAVSGYLRRHGEEWSGYFDAAGRGVPDIAALGVGYQIYSHDKIQLTGGTSASAPVFAAIVALLNEERRGIGRPWLGFLNPWIYGRGKGGFTDIDGGSSIGCQGTSLAGLASPVIPNAGWRAVCGWDPATGVGTPLYDELRKLM